MIKYFLIAILFCSTAIAQRFVSVAPNIASLLSYNVSNPNGTNVFVNGFSTFNDGGQGTLSWYPNDSSTVDYGTIWPSTSGGVGRWKRQYDGPVDIRWFGAKGDGVTDNYTNFVNAFACAQTKEVLVPFGTFKIGTALSFPSKLVLKGMGPSSVISFNNLNYGFYIGAGITNVVIQGLKISGPGIQGIRIDGATNILIFKNDFTGFAGEPNITSSYCTPIYSLTANQLSIIENNFYGNGNTLTNFGLGAVADIVCADSNPVTGLKILNNTINETMVDNPISVYFSLDAEIRGNNINQGNYRRGVPLAVGSDSVGYPIVVYNSASQNSNIRILDNFITNSAGSGIYVQGADRIQIRGNVIHSADNQQRGTNVPCGGIVWNGGSYGEIVGNQIFNIGLNNSEPVAAIATGTIVSNLVIAHNIISHSTNRHHGIWLRGAGGTGVTIANNVITNANNGIFANPMTNGIISGNLINGATNGIFAGTTVRSAVVGNNLNECQVGIWIFGGSTNVISDNTIQRVAGTGNAIENSGTATGIWDNNVIGYANTVNSSGTYATRDMYGTFRQSYSGNRYSDTTVDLFGYWYLSPNGGRAIFNSDAYVMGSGYFGTNTEKIKITGYQIQGVGVANQPIIMSADGTGYIGLNSGSGKGGLIGYDGYPGSVTNTVITFTDGIFRVVPSGSASTFTGTMNASTGYKVADAAGSGLYLRGDGTKGVFSALNGTDMTTGTVAPARLGSGTTDATTYLAGDGTWKLVSSITGSTGTVTSVGLSLPGIFSVSGSPVTTSGTLTGSLVAQTSNTFLAGPTSGAAATPTFRAFNAADIPDGQVVATSKLSATGTKNSSTFLRGDDTWAVPSGGSGGTFFANPSASIGLSAVNGSDTNAMRADAAPALSQAIAPTWTGTHIFRKTTSPVQFQYDSTHIWDITLDSAGTPLNSTTTGTNSFSGHVNATVGYTVNGAAASASYLRGDGTKGVFASLSASDLATGTVPTARLGSGVADSSTFLRGDNTWAIPSGGSGTFFADPSTPIDLSQHNGTSTNAMRADAAPALSQSISPTWSALHSWINSTTNQMKIGYDVTQITWLSTDSSGNFNIFPTSTEVNVAGYVDAQLGFKVNNAAASGSYLRGDGTKGVFASLSASDLATGTVPTARLGSGTANSTTFLSGDQTYKTAVTSVSATVPAEFSVSGVPITTTGTIAINKANQSANTVWAGPTSGSAAAPSFRSLVQADFPNGIPFVIGVGPFNTTSVSQTDILQVPTGKTFVFVSMDIYIISTTGLAADRSFNFSVDNNTDGVGGVYAITLVSGDPGIEANNVFNFIGNGVNISNKATIGTDTVKVTCFGDADPSANSSVKFYLRGYYLP